MWGLYHPGAPLRPLLLAAFALLFGSGALACVAEVDDGLDDFAEEDMLKRGGTCPEFAYPFTSRYTITSPFGMRGHPIRGGRRFHAGTDFGAPTGTPLLALFDGTVTLISQVRRGVGYGNYVDLRQAGGEYTARYAHLVRFADYLKTGASVRQGDVIGYVGSTGLSTGPHLHLELRRGSTPLNPMSFITAAPGDHENCGIRPAEVDWKYPNARDVELSAKFFGDSGVREVRFYAHRNNLKRANPNGMQELCPSTRNRTCSLALRTLSSHKRSLPRARSNAAGIHIEAQGYNASGHMVARGFAVVPDPFEEKSGRFFLRRRLADAHAGVHAFEFGIERPVRSGKLPLSVCATVGSEKEECWPLAHAHEAPKKTLGNSVERIYLRSSLNTLASRVFRVSNRADHGRICRGHSPPQCYQSAVFLK